MAAPTTPTGTPTTEPQTLAQAMQAAMTSQAPTGASAGEETQSLSQLMQAKTGSVAPAADGGAPRLDSTQERGASAANLATAKQTQIAGEGSAARVQGELDTKQAEMTAGQQQITDQDAQQRQAYSDKAAQVAAQLKQNMGQLDAEKTKAATAQIGVMSRLATDEYVTNLQNAGAELRLDQEVGFKQALTMTVLGDQQALFASKEAAVDALNVDDNTFRTQLAQMDTAFAMQLATVAAAGQNSVAEYTAAGGVVTAGAAGATKISNASDDSDDEEEAPPQTIDSTVSEGAASYDYPSTIT